MDKLMEEDFQINQNFLDLFRDLIKSNLGINISREKDYLIQNKLSRLLKKSKYNNLSDFYKALKGKDHESLEELIKYITTNHTFFYRESNHLKILRNDIKIRNIYNPVIWCAASSTGEEVYSIIIELLEHGITEFRIIATDINKDVLMHMKKGIYSRERMKEMDINMINKYFDQIVNDDNKRTNFYRAKDYIKKYFIAKKINLIEDIKFEKKFDYIFCRNVLIYFDLETQRKVILNLIKNMKDLGYLFVGHSESLLNVTDKVEAVFSSVYNKKL
jgi:chemotaxis protein methyltransferase CheR